MATRKDNLGALNKPSAANDSSQGYDAGSEWFDTVTGSIWKCVDPTVGAAVWTLVAVNNKSWPVGCYLTDDITGTAQTASPAINTMSFTPLKIPFNCTVDMMGMYLVTAQASAKMRTGIWSVGDNGLPDKLIWDAGEIDLSGAIGSRFTALGIATLRRGLVFLSSVINVTPVALALARTSSSLYNRFPVTDLNEFGSGSNFRGLAAAFTYGALPADTSGLTIAPVAGGNFPVVGIRRAS